MKLYKIAESQIEADESLMAEEGAVYDTREVAERTLKENIHCFCGVANCPYTLKYKVFEVELKRKER